MTTDKTPNEKQDTLIETETPLVMPEKPASMSTDPVTSGEPEDLFRTLLQKIRMYHPSGDLQGIERAYEIAREAHKDQRRRSGEPYIIHPLCVAIILAELELDKESIVAAILHDVVEDTVMTLEELAAEFGDEVALLVDGVTKLTQLSWQTDKLEIQAENLRHMFLAMAKDIRVILVKLADRLHNMRTLEYMTTAKQMEKARETLEIYAPIADRLGISKIKTELDDLSLKYLEPDVYYDLLSRLTATEADRERFIRDIIAEVKLGLEKAEIDGQINGRVKHIFSIYKKMKTQDKTLDQVYDVFAVRILVESVRDCYAALGVMHEMYTPLPGRFKDYIAMPKPNMYQSLHTTLISNGVNGGTPFEIQIRTYDMHRTAEYGIAAHWKYKESGSGQKLEQSEADKMKWLKDVLDWQKDTSDNQEFLSTVKNDFNMFNENIYCFTPNGDVKALPNGSTPVDFAYSIHSAVGNKMVGARVNNKLVPIDYVIQNGDRIEIITSQNSRGPSRDWLKSVRSSQARNKINQWFKSEFKEENILKGKELVEKYCKAKNIVFSDVSKPEYMDVILRKYGFRDWESVLAAIGHGGLKEGQVMNRMVEEYERHKRAEITDAQVMDELREKTAKVTPGKMKGGIVVKGIHDLAVHFSKCCNPVPGDEIVGFVTRGRGISIHRTDCINMMNLPEMERARIIEAEWQVPEGESTSKKYTAELRIFAYNRTGIMVEVTKIFTERNLDIQTMNARTNKQGKCTLTLGFEVGGTEELSRLIEKLRQIEGVIDIERATGG